MKAVSLNIELNKHFHRFVPILKKKDANVFCVQEIYKDDVALLKKKLKYKYSFFVPMNLLPYLKKPDTIDPYKLTKETAFDINKWIKKNKTIPKGTFYKDKTPYKYKEVGIATFSKYPMTSKSLYYRKTRGGLLVHDSNRRDKTMSHCLIKSTISIKNKIYTILNTHFTWSKHGKFSQQQKKDFLEMRKILSKIPSFLFYGDFNSPRGSNGVFDRLSNKYKDNIPNNINSTIDSRFHRSGNLPYVVDGIFSTENYEVSKVEIFDGVSDHKGIYTYIV